MDLQYSTPHSPCYSGIKSRMWSLCAVMYHISFHSIQSFTLTFVRFQFFWEVRSKDLTLDIYFPSILVGLTCEGKHSQEIWPNLDIFSPGDKIFWFILHFSGKPTWQSRWKGRVMVECLVGHGIVVVISFQDSELQPPEWSLMILATKLQICFKSNFLQGWYKNIFGAK